MFGERQKLSKPQPLETDTNDSNNAIEKFDNNKNINQNNYETSIDIVSCEVINYILHEKVERVFAIVELKTIESARIFIEIFQGALFKDCSLYLKPAKKGLLVLFGVSETVSTSEIYSILYSQFPFIKWVKSQSAVEHPYNSGYILLSFESFNEAWEAKNALQNHKSQDLIKVLGDSFLVSHADPFVKYDVVWNLVNTNSLIVSEVNYKNSMIQLGKSNWRFPYSIFPNILSLRVYLNRMVVTTDSIVLEYFAPNTDITYLNFDWTKVTQEILNHDLNNKGQFIINFTDKGMQDSSLLKVEPWKLMSSNSICK